VTLHCFSAKSSVQLGGLGESAHDAILMIDPHWLPPCFIGTIRCVLTRTSSITLPAASW
jgi:hypothetical protein